MTCIDGATIDGDPYHLFGQVEAGRRALLIAGATPLGGLRSDEVVADLFCGGGGWGDGARGLGIEVGYAVNHDGVAIGTHQANYPDCHCHQGDAWRTPPGSVVGDARVGLLLASAACTTHSRAAGAAPISPRVHMLGWCIARWMHDVAPRITLIENVPEWEGWGPTIIKRHRNGKPVRDDKGRILRVQDPKRRGQQFRKWWRYCTRLGYQMEKRVLDAPDFGAASRRRRLFIIARRDGAPIVWPEATHGKITKATPARTRAHRTAAECIDWSDLGRSIFERKTPLRPKTLARICEGIRRYVLNDPAPFFLRVTQGHAPGAGWHVTPIDAPLNTQTTRQDLAVCTPIIATTGYGEREGQAARVHRVSELLGTCVDGVKQGLVTPIMVGTGGPARAGEPARLNRPLGAVMTRDHRAVVAPVMAYLNHGGKQTGRVDELLRTVVSGGGHAMLVAALMMEFYGANKTCRRADQSLGCVTTLDRHGLVCCLIDGVEWVIVDILFRMLRPLELAAAMGFRADYSWPIHRGGSQRDTVRLIGNAVSPPQARALIGAVLPLGRLPDKKREVAA